MAGSVDEASLALVTSSLIVFFFVDEEKRFLDPKWISVNVKPLTNFEVVINPARY